MLPRFPESGNLESGNRNPEFWIQQRSNPDESRIQINSNRHRLRDRQSDHLSAARAGNVRCGQLVHRVLDTTVAYGHGHCLPSSCSLRREWTCADDVLAAVAILEDFDRKDQAHATHADRFRAAQALGAAGIAEQNRALRSAVALLVSEAPRDQVRLGFLASDVREAKTALGEWVRALNLTRGLLTGADENGVPIEVPGPIFVK